MNTDAPAMNDQQYLREFVNTDAPAMNNQQYLREFITIKNEVDDISDHFLLGMGLRRKLRY